MNFDYHQFEEDFKKTLIIEYNNPQSEDELFLNLKLKNLSFNFEKFMKLRNDFMKSILEVKIANKKLYEFQQSLLKFTAILLLTLLLLKVFRIFTFISFIDMICGILVYYFLNSVLYYFLYHINRKNEEQIISSYKNSIKALLDEIKK